MVVASHPVPAPAAGGDPSKAGAYCPLPEPGQKPACLAPAEARYGDFFASLEAGEVSREDAARIEAALAGGEDESYLALSTLAYGYWRLALRANETEQIDPEVLAQLERWNQQLSGAYARDAADPAFRQAVRAAASDLDARTPAEGLRCVDDAGQAARCRPTDGLVASLDSFDDRLGIRGAVKRVLERIAGDDG